MLCHLARLPKQDDSAIVAYYRHRWSSYRQYVDTGFLQECFGHTCLSKTGLEQAGTGVIK